jgi:hypothetical protein
MAGIDILIIALTITLVIGIYVLQPTKEHRFGAAFGSFFSRVGAKGSAFMKKPVVATVRDATIMTGVGLGGTAIASAAMGGGGGGGGGEGSPDEEGVPDGPLGDMSMEQTMISSSSSAASSAMSFSMMMMMMMMMMGAQ